MAIGVMQWVWTHSKAKKGSRLVLLAIADCAAADGSNAFPSNTELIRKTALSERGIQLAIADCERLGELEVTRESGKGNRYRIIMATPAEDAPPQEMPPAESAGVQDLPPAEIAPPQNLRPTPAESAPVTVSEPSGSSLPTGENTNARTREGESGDPDPLFGDPPDAKPKTRRRKGGPKTARAPEDDQADELTNAFRERYQTAHSWIAIRGVVRTALNQIPRDDVARALDLLGREKRAISQGTLQTAYAQVVAAREGRDARASPDGKFAPGTGAAAPIPTHDDWNSGNVEVRI